MLVRVKARESAVEAEYVHTFPRFQTFRSCRIGGRLGGGEGVDGRRWYQSFEGAESSWHLVHGGSQGRRDR